MCFRPSDTVPAASMRTPVDISGFVPFDGTRGTGYVFPGLSGNMVLVVASIGSEGLLGTEALQSCLPHQLDLQTGQLWANGQSTLQVHQQWQAARASAHLTSLLVLPPDSEIVAPMSIHSPSGVHPGWCSLFELQIAVIESYGVLVGRTLVDASEWSASVGEPRRYRWLARR